MGSFGGCGAVFRCGGWGGGGGMEGRVVESGIG
jgi:hypothetical protein